MNSFLLVLVNLPEAAAHIARYAAALGRPLGLRLTLLHCYLYPTLLEPELVGEVVEQLDRNEAETLAARPGPSPARARRGSRSRWLSGR